MHTKLGEQNIFALFPFANPDLTTRAGAAEALGVVIGGPSMTLAGNFAEAAGFFSRGEVYRGIEMSLPKLFKDSMAAWRYANEGYTLRNGDVIVQPEEFSPWLLSDAIGLPSREIATIKWTRGQQFEIEQFYRNRTSEIKRGYAKAHEARDTAAMARYRQEWLDLQAGKDRVRPFFGDSPEALRRQPLSVLLRHPRTVDRREARHQDYMQGAF